MPSINIPFPGLYESLLSSELDSVEEMNAEHYAEQQGADGVPPELRLEANDFAQIFFDVTRYSIAHNHVAKEYCASFDIVASEALGVPLRLKFEEMSSPREYNFTTDRIFAATTHKAIRALFTQSKRDKHATLARVIARRFTSRDGFISFYRNDLDSWLAKPLRNWDENELGTLLIACLELAGEKRDELEMSVYYGMSDSSAFFNATDAAVDWPAFEEKVAELRADREAELRADDPDYTPPQPRCPFTLDLFEQRK